MNTKRKATGRPPIYGDVNCTERINVAVTPSHKKMLEKLAKATSVSAWLRQTIEREYSNHQKAKT